MRGGERRVARGRGQARLIPGAAGGKGEVRGRKMTFYERVSEQVETLFSEHPREEALEKLLPFTRWVRVEFADDGRYYVVGLVGERPDYLCYGLPGEYASDAPGGASWLPLDVRDPHGKGYWLLYQDAATGKSVSLSGWDGYNLCPRGLLFGRKSGLEKSFRRENLRGLLSNG